LGLLSRTISTKLQFPQLLLRVEQELVEEVSAQFQAGDVQPDQQEGHDGNNDNACQLQNQEIDANQLK